MKCMRCFAGNFTKNVCLFAPNEEIKLCINLRAVMDGEVVDVPAVGQHRWDSIEDRFVGRSFKVNTCQGPQ